jgi:HSP20 family protein
MEWGEQASSRDRKGGIGMKSLMRWDPFTMLRAGDPFEELRTMQREMDRMFGRLLGGEEREIAGLWKPRIESYVKDGILHIKAEIPGIEPKDLEVSIRDRDLVIKGERKEEKDETKKDFSYCEISYGSFERHFVLPEGVKEEDLKAKFTNGILELTVPVPEIPKAKKIAIESKEVKELGPKPAVKKAA